ncbi:MAG: hypothetical protein IJS90_02625 [Clostridia bacterium]|nr:hypothetical protein [Clostridia bacterium]
MRAIFALIVSWFKKLFHIGSNDETTAPEIDEPEIAFPDHSEIVCYYGCPNSKKAGKLQLEKKLYR